jgi:hypothetical protein
VLSPATGS